VHFTNEDTNFTLRYLSLLSSIFYEDAEKSQEAVKQLLIYIVMVNLHFSVIFNRSPTFFSGRSPFYTTVSDKLKQWTRLVKLKHIIMTDPTVGYTNSEDCVATFI